MKNEEFKDRLVNAEWDTDISSGHTKNLYEAVIQIYAENNMTLLADITAALADMKVVLVSINTKKRTNDEMSINLTVGCKNSEHFNSIISRLRSIRHIINITRGTG